MLHESFSISTSEMMMVVPLSCFLRLVPLFISNSGSQLPNHTAHRSLQSVRISQSSARFRANSSTRHCAGWPSTPQPSPGKGAPGKTGKYVSYDISDFSAPKMIGLKLRIFVLLNNTPVIGEIIRMHLLSKQNFIIVRRYARHLHLVNPTYHPVPDTGELGKLVDDAASKRGFRLGWLAEQVHACIYRYACCHPNYIITPSWLCVCVCACVRVCVCVCVCACMCMCMFMCDSRMHAAAACLTTKGLRVKMMLLQEQPIRGGWRHYTSSDLTAAYRQGQTTPVEVVEATIAMIRESLEPGAVLVSFSELLEEDARAQARESARRWASNQPLGPLDGVPVAVKNALDVRGYHNTEGTKFLGEYKGPSASDSAAVHRLRSAGAIIVGMTCMHEIGMGVTGQSIHERRGPHRNPHNLSNYAGGSSSGRFVLLCLLCALRCISGVSAFVFPVYACL